MDSANPMMSAVTSTVMLKTVTGSADCRVASDWPDHVLTFHITGAWVVVYLYTLSSPRWTHGRSS